MHADHDANADNRPTVSVVIPMHNEQGAVAGLVQGICAAASDLPAFEIIAVDDGSTDGTYEALQAMQKDCPQLRILQHKTAGGQSAAVHSGVKEARADICCTLDGDGQNPPEELPKIWAPLVSGEDDTIGLVAGQRVGRKDTASKKLASRFANALRGWMLKDGTRDTGCGFKAFRTQAFLDLPFFNHMHRYLPALFKAYGWNIALVDVAHQERLSGQSKYTNFGRAMVGIWDLFGVVWLTRRAKSVSATEASRS
ncbi:dolichol-phosphate mannosyltransferase [Ruegeria sp. ANG-R]|uniref:glycosyltransferase family 2 protein n=1 Tax=Ruegeria sp. ANG-R TaxID=1577903 RepID=UPI00057D25E3|nr:glycosyltransferase family 2 protein [Ruegeria sp. ANG-R]KIC38508.1 dolichol-phosphate mannosyltransferase [Ruegeria sp. ANG-R]